MAADLLFRFNECVNGDTSPSDSSSDEEEGSQDEPDKATTMLSGGRKENLLNLSKSMAELCNCIQATGKFEKFKPKVVMFAKTSLTLLHSPELSSQQESSELDNVLANYDMVRVKIPADGNCLFLTIAHALQPESGDVFNHLQFLGLTDCSLANNMSYRLRKLVVDE